MPRRRRPGALPLNEVYELLVRLPPADLRMLLDEKVQPLEGCDYHCGCNDVLCGCRGTKAGFEGDAMSRPEFERLRSSRVEELRAQIERLEESS